MRRRDGTAFTIDPIIADTSIRFLKTSWRHRRWTRWCTRRRFILLHIHCSGGLTRGLHCRTATLPFVRRQIQRMRVGRV